MLLTIYKQKFLHKAAFRKPKDNSPKIKNCRKQSDRRLVYTVSSDCFLQLYNQYSKLNYLLNLSIRTTLPPGFSSFLFLIPTDSLQWTFAAILNASEFVLPDISCKRNCAARYPLS